MRDDLIFIKFPTGKDSRDEVVINVEEIASYRSITVVSYAYMYWTEVILKNGEKHVCHVKLADFEAKLKKAVEEI